MNALANIDQSTSIMPPKRNEAVAVIDPIPLLDSARFEHMQRIAAIMARSPLVPDSLRCVATGSGDNKKKELLPFEEALSNCFLVVNQAVRWNMDPFAVAQCVSVVHGRLCYEGKLVAAVLEQKLGISLVYEWNSSSGDAMAIKVTGTFPNGRVESVSGTVGQWKTTGNNSPWGKYPKLMLAYRGSREWARLYAPGVMLGVYTEDELQDMQDGARAHRARDMTPPKAVPSQPAPARLSAPPPASRASSPPASQRPATPPAAQRQAAPEPEPAEEQPTDQEPDLEAMVAQFEEDAAVAQTHQDLEDCGAALLPYVNGELSHLMGRDLRTRCENAWTYAEKRFAHSPSGRPMDQADEAGDEPEIDPNDPDYKRGYEDAKKGVKKCLKAEIRDDEQRFSAWKAGYDAGLEG